MNVSDMLKQVEDYERKLKEFDDRFCKRLADDARDIADAYYRSAEYAGDNDVIVNVVPNGHGSYRVVANGRAVLFIEFGTGISKLDAPKEERDMIIRGDVVQHGQYGKGLGANPKGWSYRGSIGANPPGDTYEMRKGKGMVHTRGNTSTSAMYEARKRIMQTYREVAKEVWGELQ